MDKLLLIKAASPVCCIIGAVTLAILGIDGWGWLVLAAVILA